MVQTKNLALSAIVISISIGALFLLLSGSSVPVLTVKELMGQPNPESFINRKIQVIGIVDEYNGVNFTITDPEDVTNTSLIIHIEAVYVEKPTGFEIGETVLIEGKLLTIGTNWTFEASMISTKCPSKYES